MKTKHSVSIFALTSILTLSGLGIQIKKASIQPMSAVAQSASCDGKIRSENFSLRVGSSTGINLRSNRQLDARTNKNVAYNATINLDGWAYGQSVNDLWNGKPDAIWFRLQERIDGQERWVPSAYMIGYPPSKPPTQPNCTPTPIGQIGQPDFTLAVYRQDNPFWRAGYAPSFTNPPNPKLGKSQGNCTWYASGRAKQLGRNAANVNRMTGNAQEWGTQARNANIPTSRIPQVGAIAQWDSNHVAVVEKVNSDGTVLISESSYSSQIGGSYDYLYKTRTIAANNPTRFILP
ncbi:MAG: CHAP domain-containing protein [Coleofasciculaceae cyanobacterium]